MTIAAAIAAAAGVGFGHAVLPDHWVPLAVLGRTHRYPLGRVARLSSVAGLTHVAVSLVLGAVLIVIGLQFRSAVQHAQDAVVGGLLIVTGAAFLVLELTGRGHGHLHPHGPDGHSHGPDGHSHEHGEHTHEHRHAVHGDDPARTRRGALSWIVPFGAAASPDLTILPVFVAASTAGVAPAVGALVAFAVATIGTMVALTMFATVGGYQVRAPWLDRWGNLFTAGVLLVIGVLVALGVL